MPIFAKIRLDKVIIKNLLNTKSWITFMFNLISKIIMKLRKIALSIIAAVALTTATAQVQDNKSCCKSTANKEQVCNKSAEKKEGCCKDKAEGKQAKDCKKECKKDCKKACPKANAKKDCKKECKKAKE